MTFITVVVEPLLKQFWVAPTEEKQALDGIFSFAKSFATPEEFAEFCVYLNEHDYREVD